jgi:hypothetical protein
VRGSVPERAGYKFIEQKKEGVLGPEWSYAHASRKVRRAIESGNERTSKKICSRDAEGKTSSGVGCADEEGRGKGE